MHACVHTADTLRSSTNLSHATSTEERHAASGRDESAAVAMIFQAIFPSFPHGPRPGAPAYASFICNTEVTHAETHLPNTQIFDSLGFPVHPTAAPGCNSEVAHAKTHSQNTNLSSSDAPSSFHAVPSCNSEVTHTKTHSQNIPLFSFLVAPSSFHAAPGCNAEVTQTLVNGSPWGSPMVRRYSTTGVAGLQTRLVLDGLQYSQQDIRASDGGALQVCLSLEGACPSLQHLSGGWRNGLSWGVGLMGGFLEGACPSLQHLSGGWRVGLTGGCQGGGCQGWGHYDRCGCWGP
jgi:hypothetical protein